MPRSRFSAAAISRLDQALYHEAVTLAEADRLDSARRPLLAEVAAWAELTDLADQWLHHAVREASAEHSWADIGETLGVSRQAAHERFVRRAR